MRPDPKREAALDLRICADRIRGGVASGGAPDARTLVAVTGVYEGLARELGPEHPTSARLARVVGVLFDDVAARRPFDGVAALVLRQIAESLEAPAHRPPVVLPTFLGRGPSWVEWHCVPQPDEQCTAWMARRAELLEALDAEWACYHHPPEGRAPEEVAPITERGYQWPAVPAREGGG